MAKMSAKEFIEACAAAGAHTQQQAADLLGIGLRSVVRYFNGDATVPLPVRRLLQLLKTHGAPRQWHDERPRT